MSLIIGRLMHLNLCSEGLSLVTYCVWQHIIHFAYGGLVHCVAGFFLCAQQEALHTTDVM